MRITIQAVVENDGGTKTKRTLGVITRASDYSPQSGLGLFMSEGHELLKAPQSLMIERQTEEFTRRVRRCPRCATQLAIKDIKSIVCRTAYRKLHFSSPRRYTRCTKCVQSTRKTATFSPLAEARAFDRRTARSRDAPRHSQDRSRIEPTTRTVRQGR